MAVERVRLGESIEVTVRGRPAARLVASFIAPELTALVTYDERMAEAAALLGFPVVSPA
ncbi:MAG TPA: type II toxin-antitoxin system prevent-host-death family antitoxin [Candidatus Binatia bacterium]|nr:type II toxin-antitoxin system prevent-host-death family antitoxin [Candidatus Binatia bacterium]